MTAQPDAETNGHSPSTMLDSEDSDEAESSNEEAPITSWKELSIIERVGLNSVEMSEKELETAFSQIALAFRCDQYTLKQRLQAEEHARNLAEENIQLELSRGRETLEMLKGLCLDSKRSRILQRLQLSLDILGGTVERISNTAEVLGAVHQEARVSRTVELMVAHVDNLKRRHDRNVAELEEAKRTIQRQNPCRNIVDPQASPDPEENDGRKKSSQQNTFRRRVSISLIPSQTQESAESDFKKRTTRSISKDSFLTCSSPVLNSESSCSAGTRDNRPLDRDESPAAEPPPPSNLKPECLPSKEQATRKSRNRNCPLDSLRQRHKSKAASSKKKADKDKKSVDVCRQLNTCGSWRRRRLALWLHHYRWALVCTYLFVLFCVLTLTYLLWKLHDEAVKS